MDSDPKVHLFVEITVFPAARDDSRANFLATTSLAGSRHLSEVKSSVDRQFREQDHFEDSD